PDTSRQRYGTGRGGANGPQEHEAVVGHPCSALPSVDTERFSVGGIHRLRSQQLPAGQRFPFRVPSDCLSSRQGERYSMWGWGWSSCVPLGVGKLNDLIANGP